MADELSPEGQQVTPETAPQAEAQKPTYTPEQTEAYIKQLRSEAKAARLELEKIKKAEAEKEQALLTDQGRFKELYEKAQQELDNHKKENEALKLNQLRQKVASAAGIPSELAERLRGNTEDELKADAEAMKKVLPQPSKSQTTFAPGGGYSPSQNPPNTIGGGGIIFNRKGS